MLRVKKSESHAKKSRVRSFQLLSDWNHSFLQPVYNLLSPHVLSWNSASEGTRVESVFSPWRQSENFYAVLRSKIALLKMEERRGGSQEAEEHLRGERELRA